MSPATVERPMHQVGLPEGDGSDGAVSCGGGETPLWRLGRMGQFCPRKAELDP